MIDGATILGSFRIVTTEETWVKNLEDAKWQRGDNI